MFRARKTASGAQSLLPGALIGLLILLSCFVWSSCRGPRAIAFSDAPVHLEDHLAVAEIAGSEVSSVTALPVEWSFDRPRADWEFLATGATTVSRSRTADSLRMELAPASAADSTLTGYLMTEIPDWRLEDWDYVLVRARSSGGIGTIGLRLNILREREEPAWEAQAEDLVFVNDGAEHTYVLRTSLLSGELSGTWRQLAINVSGSGPNGASVDILTVRVVSKQARFVAGRVGTERETREGINRRVLFTHAPGRVTYRLRVPEAGRLDFGLGALDDERDVTFRVSIRTRAGEQSAFEESHGLASRWAQRTIDLSGYSGDEIELALESDAEGQGAVALWGAPTISGARASDRPNVIVYLIDGLGAELTSAYGHENQTTPTLDWLASQGALFENAFSNSSWTKPSTSTLMTSLHSSVLGGFRTFSDPLPEEAMTMAEHFHSAGYQTAVLTSNPFAGRASSLERGADLLQDSSDANNCVSSDSLHEAFLRWRREYPGEPFWAHFQSTDVHSPYRPGKGLAGLFSSSESRSKYATWSRLLEAAGGAAPSSPAWEALGIDQTTFRRIQRGLYEDCLHHNDRQLARLVDSLKETGEWSNTLLVVTSDHGTRAAGLLPEADAPSHRVLASSYETRIPLVMVWPGRIAAGQRIPEPVSLIDLLPTVLELAELPSPRTFQGRTLVPLLFGGDWESSPVILEEVFVDGRTGHRGGLIEIIDGQWAASLRFGSPNSPIEPTEVYRPAPLLLFDLSKDPRCLESLHDELPKRSDEYSRLLGRQWRRNQELAKQFTRREGAHLGAEQLQTLRSLGYL